MNSESLFEAFLSQHDQKDWSRIIDDLLPSIHEIDRNATRIWFHFYPLALARAFRSAEDPQALARELVIQGSHLLCDRIDTSHRFLYGHRYWPDVKAAVIEHAASTASIDLAQQIHEVSQKVAKKIGIDESLTVGITAVAFMTLQQVGADDFRAWPGKLDLEQKIRARSPAQILRERARDDSQGLFGFLRGERKEFTITFDENDERAKFKLINSQHLTTAAAADHRPYHLRDPRCTINEGPIPVQCRSASCGTCWIGVLAGAEKLSPVGGLEGRAMKKFGYIDTSEKNPMIRLACQSQASGAVSIVIPPWNGVFGKLLRGQDESAAEDQVERDSWKSDSI
jgi:ferredoxin